MLERGVLQDAGVGESGSAWGVGPSALGVRVPGMRSIFLVWRLGCLRSRQPTHARLVCENGRCAATATRTSCGAESQGAPLDERGEGGHGTCRPPTSDPAAPCSRL